MKINERLELRRASVSGRPGERERETPAASERGGGKESEGEGGKIPESSVRKRSVSLVAR